MLPLPRATHGREPKESCPARFTLESECCAMWSKCQPCPIRESSHHVQFHPHPLNACHGLTTWAHNMGSQHRGYGGEKKTVPPPKKRRSPFPVFGGEGEKKEEEQCKKDQYRKRCPSLSSLSTFAVPLLWHFHLPSACCSVERQCGVIASTELGKQTLP